MSWEKSHSILARLDLAKKLRHASTKTSQVTTGWGVDWDETLIARDIMQNFYDANRSWLEKVKVVVNQNTVEVSAPSRFNLDLLFYLGSEKGPQDVGHYGEGFKVAALCLLRDHRVTPIMQCGNDVVCMRVADAAIQTTGLYPLDYDFFVADRSYDGARLILPGASKKLAREMETGLQHFFYEKNPILAEKLWSLGDDYSMYRSGTGATGHIFYRNLKRGQIADIPLVLVINKEVKTIENRIKNDRDRNAFGEKLLETFYKTFAKQALRYNRLGQRAVIEAARGCWERGHPFLSAIADTAGYQHPLLDGSAVTAVFGDQNFARSHSRLPAEQLRYDELERKWVSGGRQGLPAYFARFGVNSAETYIRDLEEKAKQEAHRTESRPPTDAERNGLGVLKEVIHELAPDLMTFFDNRQTTYTVARTEVVLGELKNGRPYRSWNVFLAEQVFDSDFAHALAVCLHEHAHVFGHDGSRGFTDVLTELIEAVVREHRTLDQYEANWEKVRARVRKERKKVDRSGDKSAVSTRLNSMDETQLRALLAQVPDAVMKRLLDKRSREW